MNILIGDEVYIQNPHEKHQLEWGVVTKIRGNKSDWTPSYEIFDNPSLHKNPFIQILSPAHGGHCGFFQRAQSQEDPFWAENRIVDWIQDQVNA